MNVLISGAQRGLGACLTKKFLSCGHRVWAGLVRLDEPGELSAVWAHPSLTPLQLDVTQPAEMEAAAQALGRQAGTLDIVIHVAGVLLNREGFITKDRYEDLLRTFQVNTIGPIYLNNLLLPLMEGSKNATVVCISSEVTAIDGVGPRFGAYCMSKTAIAQYAFILKQTLREQGRDMRVFSVHPGRMKTEMGAENGQIKPEESTEGIYAIAIGDVIRENELLYVDYRGNGMLS